MDADKDYFTEYKPQPEQPMNLMMLGDTQANIAEILVVLQSGLMGKIVSKDRFGGGQTELTVTLNVKKLSV